jgi:hypothetical protein
VNFFQCFVLNLYCVYCIVNSFALNENHGAVIVNFLEHQLSSLFLLCVINNEVVIVNPMNGLQSELA